MSRYSCQDDYSYPNSGVLRNKFDVEDQKKLNEIEEEFVTLRSFELSEEIIDPPFSIDTIKYIHKKLFGDMLFIHLEMEMVELKGSLLTN